MPRKRNWRLNRQAAAIHALIFIATAITVAIVPLLPQIAQHIAIDPVQSGALLAAPSLAMVIVSIPAGLLADRIGARGLTRVAALVLTAGVLGQGLAQSFVPLMAARLVIGIASGVAWTTGLLWLSDLQPDGKSANKPLAAAATSGGVGLVAGPAIGAVLGRQLGLATPFLVLGVDRGHRVEGGKRTSTRRGVLRLAWREPALVSGAAGLVLSSLASGAINLLAPLELHVAGISTQSIGLVFSAAAGLYIVATVLVVRRIARLITVSTLGMVLVAMAAALMPATISVSSVAVVGSVLLHAPLRATVATISYPLGASRASHVELGTGAAMGVLNGVWASAGVVGPLLAGALAQVASPRLAFAVLAAGSLLGGVALVGWRAARG
jgi:MFS family permease